MTAFIKKQGPAFYFNILSAAAGIAAFIAMVISSTMNEAYALNSFPLFVRDHLEPRPADIRIIFLELR